VNPKSKKWEARLGEAYIDRKIVHLKCKIPTDLFLGQMSSLTRLCDRCGKVLLDRGCVVTDLTK